MQRAERCGAEKKSGKRSSLGLASEFYDHVFLYPESNKKHTKNARQRVSRFKANQDREWEWRRTQRQASSSFLMPLGNALVCPKKGPRRTKAEKKTNFSKLRTGQWGRGKETSFFEGYITHRLCGVHTVIHKNRGRKKKSYRCRANTTIQRLVEVTRLQRVEISESFDDVLFYWHRSLAFKGKILARLCV